MPRLRSLSLLATFCLTLPASAASAAEHEAASGGAGSARAAGAAVGVADGGAMVRLPAGSYRPLYGLAGDPPTRVAAFRLDRDPVTRGDFLEFVRRHPDWRRSAVRPLFADRAAYLANWAGDLDVGAAADARRPVTGVSWFAARAYCRARGKRLPTVAEWEYAAAADASSRDAAREPLFVQHLVTLYSGRSRHAPEVATGATNAYGVRGLHDLVWEWVDDFNSVLVSDDSRAVGGRDHSLFCASGAIGAADPSNYPAFLRYAFRAGLTGATAVSALGFRCAA